MSEQLPPETPTPAPTGDKKGIAVASLVIGILGLCFPWIPYAGLLGIIGSIVGLILGIKGLKTSGKGMAIAGIVLAVVSFLLWIIALFTVQGIAILLLLGPAIGDVFSQINSSLVSP